MRRVTLAVCSAIALSLAACGEKAPVGGGAPASGIEGLVSAGPQCPVVVQGSPCPDAPWRGTVRVTTPDGALVEEVETDNRGRFHVPLAAGVYQVVAVTGSTPPPTSAPEAVTVSNGDWIEITLTVDTGVR